MSYTKKKKNILFTCFSVLFATCFSCGVLLCEGNEVFQAKAEIGGTLSVSDDFQTGDLSESNAYAYDGVVTDKGGHFTYGLIPAKTWGASVEACNGYITYTLSADEGYCLDEVTLDFTAVFGHGCAQTYFDSENVNLNVWVSSDDEDYKKVYNIYDDKPMIQIWGQNAQEQATNREQGTYDISLDLSPYASNTGSVFVKLEMKHKKAPDLYASWTTLDLDRFAINLHNVSLTATQKEVGDIVVSDDFEKGLDGESATLISQSSVYEYSNVINDKTSTFGLVPSTAWGAKIDTNEGYIVYKISAMDGYYINGLTGVLNVGYGHGSYAEQWSHNDIKVSLGYDGKTYNEVYSLRKDTTIVADGETDPKNNAPTEAVKRYTVVLDLTDEMEDASTLYVKITLKIPQLSQVALGNVGTILQKTSFTASQTKIDGISISDDFTSHSVTASDAYEYGNMITHTTGNGAFGLVPADKWAGSVNTDNGYLKYKVSSNGAFVLNNLTFSARVKYELTKPEFDDGSANFIVSYSYDDITYLEAYNHFRTKGIQKTTGNSETATAQTITCSLSEYAKNCETLYIKLDVICPAEGNIMLQKIPTCLLGVEITASQKPADPNRITLTSDFATAGTLAQKGVVESFCVAKDTNGNKDWALIPSATWGGTVSAGEGYVVYKVSAGEEKVFSNMYFEMNYFLKSGANFIISVSADGTKYMDCINLVALRGDKAYTSGVGVYAIDLATFVKNMQQVYVKITMVHPDGQYSLQKLLARLHSVTIKANVKDVASYGDYGFVDGIDGAISDSGNFVVDNGGIRLADGQAEGEIVYQINATQGNVMESLSVDISGQFNDAENLSVYVGANENALTKAYANVGGESLASVDLSDFAYGMQSVFVKVKLTGNALVSGISFFGSEFALNSGSVVYYLNGGYYTGESNPTSFTETDGVITLLAPVQEYKTFAGWYTNATFTGEAVTTIDASVLRAYRLYAKWTEAVYSVQVIIEGDGVVSGAEITQVSAGKALEFTLSANDGSIIYGLNVNGTDVFLTNGTYYKISKASENYVIVAKFLKRATITQDFAVNYSDNPIYGNGWKVGLYDYANLYITDGGHHSLGINNGQGYIVYKFATPNEDTTFTGAILTTTAKLFDNYCLGTNEKVDYYIGYDGADYQLVYKSEFCRKGENNITLMQNITEYIYGKKEFFLKIEVGSNSTNWTLLKDLKIEFNYSSDEEENPVVDSYGISYVLDGGTNANNPTIAKIGETVLLQAPTKEGYVFAGWYLDAEYTTFVTEISADNAQDITLYAKWVKSEIPSAVTDNKPAPTTDSGCNGSIGAGLGVMSILTAFGACLALRSKRKGE